MALFRLVLLLLLVVTAAVAQVGVRACYFSDSACSAPYNGVCPSARAANDGGLPTTTCTNGCYDTAYPGSVTSCDGLPDRPCTAMGGAFNGFYYSSTCEVGSSTTSRPVADGSDAVTCPVSGSSSSIMVIPDMCPCVGIGFTSDCGDGSFCCSPDIEGMQVTAQFCLPGALFPGDLECQDYAGLIGLIIGICCGLACLVGGAMFLFVGSKPRAPPTVGAYGGGPSPGAYQEGGGGSYGKGQLPAPAAF